jgi:hypothetical protein
LLSKQKRIACWWSLKQPNSGDSTVLWGRNNFWKLILPVGISVKIVQVSIMILWTVSPPFSLPNICTRLYFPVSQTNLKSRRGLLNNIILSKSTIKVNNIVMNMLVLYRMCNKLKWKNKSTNQRQQFQVKYFAELHLYIYIWKSWYNNCSENNSDKVR